MITTITSRETVLFAAIEKLEVEKKELMEALQAMLTYFAMDEDDWSKPIKNKAHRAIARATGEAL